MAAVTRLKVAPESNPGRKFNTVWGNYKSKRDAQQCDLTYFVKKVFFFYLLLLVWTQKQCKIKAEQCMCIV